MIDLDIEICVCNSLTVQDIANCAKENNFTTLPELLENDICPMGDKCESCQNEGFHDDGLNLSLVLSLIKKGKI